MNKPDLHRCENIRLVLDCQHPEVKVDTYLNAIPEEGCLVRNLFSLTGTLPEESLLNSLSHTLKLTSHPGYSSVGRVEDVGSNCYRFRPGDLLLIPVQYSTYSVFDNVQIRNTSRFSLTKIPLRSDPVCTTFAPLVSLALYLISQMTATLGEAGDEILFLGCGLLGAVLLKILRLETSNIKPIICTQKNDLACELLLKNGAQEVISYEQLLHEKSLDKVHTVFILSSFSREYQALLAKLPIICNCISALSVEEITHSSWLQYYAFEEVLDILHDSSLTVDDLVTQHVHLESFPQIYNALHTNYYHGQALIYDW